MEGIFRKLMAKISPSCRDEDGNNYAYVVFRLVVASMFFLHGAQKIFGMLGGTAGTGNTVPFASLFWFAGLTEVAVGALIFVGIFTRLAALLAVIEMAVAYAIVHFSKGIIPLLNGGELAVMYLISFLVIFRYGVGKLSLEKVWHGREIF